jgi:hypothetical protein
MKRILLIPLWITAIVTRNQGRIFKIALMTMVFITALYTKDYRGEHQTIINNHIGGILYVLFGSLLFSVVFPRMKLWQVTLLALGITCLLEFIQYFRFPFMVELTKIKAIAYLFGTSFNGYDFIYYALGALLGFAMLLLLSHKEAMNNFR